jgi:LysR family transcriptional regulator, glycine cleavage system transcriptional activator
MEVGQGCRRLNCCQAVSPESFGTQLSAEYLDVAAAVAGHGIAIGSLILFRNELASGRLIPAHDVVAGDGRAFWLAYPVARQNSHKIARFREWLCDEAASDRSEARTFIRSAVAAEP